MDLHLNYEKVNPYPLQTSEVSKTSEVLPTTRLIARKEKGIIEIDSQTTLKGVPAEAWEYRLGTYSALEWVLERYKEKKPKDPPSPRNSTPTNLPITKNRSSNCCGACVQSA